MDDEMGVAVVFDDEEDDSEIDEIREDDVEEDEDGVVATTDKRIQYQGGLDDTAMDTADSSSLSVHEIDAHWLQRGLSKFYNDANLSAAKADEVLSVLAIQDDRECENALVDILDYDKFDLIKVLMRNRAKVYYCTRLKQAQDGAEKERIEQEMRADLQGGGPMILEALNAKASAESWVADRMGDFASKARQDARAMNKKAAAPTGASAVNAGDVEEAIGTGDGYGDKKPERLLDLEALTFHAGNHTMTNKKVRMGN